MKLGRVAVLGLGQIGGSIAWKLKQARCASVVGCDHDPHVIRAARKRALAHAYTTDVTEATSGADLVLLALPVASIVAALAEPRLTLDPDSLVMDVGSTKRLILEAADGRNPPIRFVGAHPLAGNERPGLSGADPTLFSNSVWVLVRGLHARPGDYRRAAQFVRVLGGRPLEMDAATHDRITGLTIGLPHVLAILLRQVYERELRKDPRVAMLTGSSLRSATRVSASDPVMVSDLIASNKDEIERWWREMVGPLPSRRPREGRRNRSR